jgi:tRNA 2-thiouridine synthesizing protein A
MPTSTDKDRGFFASTSPAVPATRQPQVHQVIDARDISSPLPILRAHRALRSMEVGQVLKVLTREEQTLAEFQAMVNHVPGYELLSQQDAGGEYVHLLRRRR